MRSTTRVLVTAILALLSATVLGVTATVTSAASRAATALIMGTTFLSDPTTEPAYIQDAASHYIDPTTSCKLETCTLTPLVTPEQFWPFSGWGDLTIDQSIAQGANDLDAALRKQLDTGSTDPIVIFGDSQSAVVATVEKRNLADLPPAVKDQLTFVLVANPSRPNGGMLERFAPLHIPILGFTASGATPTDTGIQTVDIAFQYDGSVDLPQYPLNILADLNVLAGWNIHSGYLVHDHPGYTEDELLQAVNDPANRQTYGDTTYITIPAKHLPLVQPLRDLGMATGLSALTTPIADLVEPTLRVLVELGYDRATPYGQPTPFGLFPKIDPAKLASDLVAAADAGVKAARADIRTVPCVESSTQPATNATTTAVASIARKPKRVAAAAAARAAAAALATASPPKAPSTTVPPNHAAPTAKHRQHPPAAHRA
jgi:hypothetical protein